MKNDERSRTWRLGLLAGCFLLASCCSSKSYTRTWLEFCAVDGDYLFAVIARESGIETTKNFQFCCASGATHAPDCQRLFTVRFLMTKQPAPVIVYPGVDAELATKYEGAGDARAIRELLALPSVGSLNAGMDPAIKDVNPDSTPTLESSLGKLGFRLKNVKARMKSSSDDWYLGFGDGVVQVSCPRRAFIRTRKLDVDSRVIWDHGRSRLIMISQTAPEETAGLVRDLPTSVAVWNYRDDSLETFDLHSVSIDSLR